MGFAPQIADRICFMAKGVILEQGPPEQMFRQQREERTQRFSSASSRATWPPGPRPTEA